MSLAASVTHEFYIYARHRDETVEVGAPLYEIDTDATASVEAASSSSSNSSEAAESATASAPTEEAPKAAEQPAAAAATTTPASSSSSAAPHRTPSIQFLGKEGWAARLRGETQAVVELPPIHPMYGRPAFSEEEMEALMLGGAEQAPKIASLSSGATFTY